MKLILGISGKTYEDEADECTFGTAGSGKDTVAGFIVEKHRGVKVALADPLKRICKEVFDFSDEQLWGPSSERNKPDERWLHRKEGELGTTQGPWDENLCNFLEYPSPRDDVYLTPRHALQQLGTEWGRSCSKDVWVRYALRTADQLLEGRAVYDAKNGLDPVAVWPSLIPRYEVVIISDVRFENEVRAITKAGGRVIRVKRKVEPLPGAAGAHASEKGVSLWDDDDFDYVIDNNSTLSNLALHVDRMIALFSGRILPYSEEQKDVPPFMRGR